MQKQLQLQTFMNLISTIVTNQQVKQRKLKIHVNPETLGKLSKILREFEDLKGNDFYDKWLTKVLNLKNFNSNERNLWPY